MYSIIILYKVINFNNGIMIMALIFLLLQQEKADTMPNETTGKLYAIMPK